MKKYVLTMVCALLTLSVHAQPKGVVLDTLNVQHIDFQGQTRQGTIICNRKITNDLRAIFEALYKAKYPIERIQPISDYDNDDERSMQANNTSCYCYRPIEGSKKLSLLKLASARRQTDVAEDIMKLGISKYIDILASTRNFQFSVDQLLRSLIYGRFVSPCSKKKSVEEVFPLLYQSPQFSEDQVYDGIEFLGNEYEKVIEILDCLGSCCTLLRLRFRAGRGARARRI